MTDYEEAIKGYDNYIEHHGIDDKVTEAYKIVAVDVLENRHLREDGLKISKKAKEINQKFIFDMTSGGDFWALEEYGSAEDNDIYPEISKYVSVIGSVRLLDKISEEDIERMIYEKMLELLNGSK